jgi:hypothetical protein
MALLKTVEEHVTIEIGLKSVISHVNGYYISFTQSSIQRLSIVKLSKSQNFSLLVTWLNFFSSVQTINCNYVSCIASLQQFPPSNYAQLTLSSRQRTEVAPLLKMHIPMTCIVTRKAAAAAASQRDFNRHLVPCWKTSQ